MLTATGAFFASFATLTAVVAALVLALIGHGWFLRR
jgi:hypothetical protein